MIYIMVHHLQIQKVKSTYVDGLLPCVEKSMLYTHWDQTAAVTGRLTSTNPNIQSIPKQPLLLHGVRHSYIIGKYIILNIQSIPIQPLLLHGVRHSYIIGKYIILNIQSIPKQPLLLHGVRHSYIIGEYIILTYSPYLNNLYYYMGSDIVIL